MIVGDGQRGVVRSDARAGAGRECQRLTAEHRVVRAARRRAGHRVRRSDGQRDVKPGSSRTSTRDRQRGVLSRVNTFRRTRIGQERDRSHFVVCNRDVLRVCGADGDSTRWAGDRQRRDFVAFQTLIVHDGERHETVAGSVGDRNRAGGKRAIASGDARSRRSDVDRLNAGHIAARCGGDGDHGTCCFSAG